MAKYIDAEAFKRKLIDEKSFFPPIVARALEEMPAAEVEEIVRCEDCKRAKQMFFDGYYFCRRHRACRKATDFCSFGKRRDTQ